MRLAVTFLGLDLFSVELSTDATSPAADEYESPGDCTTYPVGFAHAYDQPDQVGLPDRGWGE